jgi:NADPH:quinone reductase-like Zn-dependent oxidoreductase
MSWEQAACISETYITAHLNLFQFPGLVDGQRVLLHGGGGGVNTAAIQLCRALAPSVTILVTASTTKVQRVRDLGVDHVIDYQQQDFQEEVAKLTDGRGVDVILDHIGAAYLHANLKSLAVNGTLMLIGVMGGAKNDLNLAQLMVKRQKIVGSVLRPRPVDEKAAIISRFASETLGLFSDGKIIPLVHKVFPLEKVVEAHKLMESSGHFGKLVLIVDSESAL